MNNYVIIFPTDTVYGIGASIYDSLGQSRIYEIKHRPLNKPLAVLCANKEQITNIAYVTDEAIKLIDAFLPGPLTLILRSKPEVKKATGLDTIGVRIPKYSVALEILEKYGPMSTTSVNESGEKSLNDYEEIKTSYGHLVDDLYAPSDEPTSSKPSTVVDVTSDTPKVLREGAITFDQILNVIK